MVNAVRMYLTFNRPRKTRFKPTGRVGISERLRPHKHFDTVTGTWLTGVTKKKGNPLHIIFLLIQKLNSHCDDVMIVLALAYPQKFASHRRPPAVAFYREVDMNEVEFYLEDLKSKFSKINPNEYYLAYSGGRDSHFLLWFIREYLHEDRIMPVFSNTGMEIPEIRDRALANAQIVLKPVLKHAEIKEKYGIPLNTKASDEWVYRYQERRESGVSDEDMPRWIKYYAMRQVDAIEHGRKTGMLSYTVVNKRTCEAMMSGELHKVSNKCCEFLKKKPGKIFMKENHKKPITGIMGAESWKRKTTFKGCFTSKGHFTPLWDLTEELRNKIEEYCGIPVPSVYKYVNQTGCAGCPYGQHGKNRFESTNIELSLCGEGQRKFILDYFAESYAFKGYNYQPRLFI